MPEMSDMESMSELYEESLRTLPAGELTAIHIARYYQGTLMWQRSGGECGLAHPALLSEAGLPDGVVNMVLGPGSVVGPICLPHPALAGGASTGPAGGRKIRTSL